MSSKAAVYLPYNVAGFIPDDMLVWLDGNVGEVVNAHKSCAVGLGWYLLRVENDGHNITERYTFVFEDESKAILFKLTWGGQ